MQLEIWSDIACPWCYVGKRRMESALAAFEHRDEVTLTWRSFELDPGAPRERSGDGASNLAAKYGMTRERALAMQENMAQVAAEDGLDLRFDRARSGNTFDAHRLLHLAAAHGIQEQAKERFMRAYLTEGEPIGDPSALARLARELGLPGEEVDALLTGDRFAAEVRADEQTAAALGVRAVPFFAVDRRVGATGAQSPEILLDMLRQSRQPPVVAAGEACDAHATGC